MATRGARPRVIFGLASVFLRFPAADGALIATAPAGEPMTDALSLLTLFNDALEHSPGSDRDAFLDRACAGNSTLRARVQALLVANDQVGHFLEPPPRLPSNPDHEESLTWSGLLAGRYELLETIGTGGMGVVRRARDTHFDRDVAVKLLKHDLLADSPTATRFRVEARITGQLQHPGIPPVYEIGTLPNGQPFLAMKLVKGRTLSDLLQERSSPSDDPGRFVAIFEQTAHAVGYVHSQQIIHRDLKPANVMVGAHGEVQVMDWGLAKELHTSSADSSRPDAEATAGHQAETGTALQDRSATRTGSILGTPSYMSPEQAAGEVRSSMRGRMCLASGRSFAKC